MHEPISEATRELMWNVSHEWAMYVLFIISLCVCAFGIYRRVQFWRRGKSDTERLSDWGVRFKVLLREVCLQKQVRNSIYPAVFHCLIFYSFVVLIATTAILVVDKWGPLLGAEVNLFRGLVYAIFSVASEIAGIFILIGLGMAAWRRYVKKPATLPSNGLEDSIVLILLAVIVITGFMVEALRIAAVGDPWPLLSFFGYAISLPFAVFSAETNTGLHAFFWWFHAVLAFAWIALIPYTKFFHMLSLPTNAFFSKLKPRGELQRQDIEAIMESAEDGELQLGIQKPEEFTWKQRLDLDVCISCGRCEEVCPSYMSDKEYFSPRQLISRLKKSLDECMAAGKNPEEVADIVGEAFDEEFIWHCRTCSACMEVCPALIDHVDTLMEFRRNEVLIQGRIPEEAAHAMKTFETGGNPLGSQSDRTDWIEKANLRVVAPGEKVDVLYWIGCCIAFDPQKHKLAEDLCRLMEKCGVDFGVLGDDEKCCGDPARVLGQEMLFQMAAKEQVELIKQREFKTLLVGCPHCYNVFKHEYRQFGGDFNVMHHSEFLRKMIEEGKIKPGTVKAKKAVYHDPCYLGRYQKIYDEPREVLRAIPGMSLSEMANRREKSLCCGAGGGHYFMDLKRGERINNIRVQQAHDAGADTIVTGCAFCMHMLQDSIKLLNYDESMRVVDIASLAAEATLPATVDKKDEADA
jgi:Fe-S oxidoreductase/nitrate reductase gamma subunit